MKQSAGLLLYRWRQGRLELLLVHPSGNYNRRAPWSIPKGELDPGEEPQQAAVRETAEETGIRASGPLVPLGQVQYRRSAKRIVAFAAPAPPEAEPRCASWEVDQARFLPLEEALARVHPDQAPLIHRLLQHLGVPPPGAQSNQASGRQGPVP